MTHMHTENTEITFQPTGTSATINNSERAQAVESIKKTRDTLLNIWDNYGFINESGLEFTNISSEEYRVYEFVDITLRIDKPVALNVSKNGHRIFDSEGVSHYIPFGWRHLYWKALPGKPNFVK